MCKGAGGCVCLPACRTYLAWISLVCAPLVVRVRGEWACLSVCLSDVLAGISLLCAPLLRTLASVALRPAFFFLDDLKQPKQIAPTGRSPSTFLRPERMHSSPSAFRTWRGCVQSRWTASPASPSESIFIAVHIRLLYSRRNNDGIAVNIFRPHSGGCS